MKEGLPVLKEMTDTQRRVFIDAVQLYEAYLEAFHNSLSYRGGMHWKKSKGREYLFRSTDRYGHGKSLGPRSPDTEKILAAFRDGKRRARQRLDALKERLKEQARFCKAASIQRVPRIVAAILRVFHHQGLLGKNVMVVGTNVIFAYEAAAGVFVDNPLMATVDLDILWDIRSRLRLAADTQHPQESGLLALLRKSDRSFERLEGQRFRAVNKSGYMVDLIKPEPRPVMKKERRRMGGESDLEAAEIRNLQWLQSAPKFTQTVIGADGYPALMTCPDPRAFALHKLWLSEQPDRDPLKKQRDRNQGIAVAYMVCRYLPQYKFVPEELKMFPRSVRQVAAGEIDGFDLPAAID